MSELKTENKLIEQVLNSAKTIAMVGVSFMDKEKTSKIIKRKPSVIVMKYLQEFGYRVIPVNPFSVGKEINEETVVANLKDITIPVDVVNVFRPSKETPDIAKETIKLRAKALWLQYGIENQEAKKIAELENIIYISNRCIKQEYQRLFLKMSPVFPALKTD